MDHHIAGWVIISSRFTTLISVARMPLTPAARWSFRHLAALMAALLVAGAALLLASCAAVPPPAIETPAAPSPEAAFAAGRYEEAASEWQARAVGASGAEAGALRIDAANAWLLAGHPDPARDNLRWIERDQLRPADAARMNVLLADIAVREDRPGEAEELLQRVGSSLPPGWHDRFAQVAENVQRMLSRPGSRDISRALDISRTLAAYDPERALALLESLENLPSGELAWRAENPRADRVFTGWLDLALVIRQHLVEPAGLEPAVDRWRGRHPFHSITRAEALDLWLRYRQQFAPPGKVAVLLPESGRFDAAARAIRDGIVSAYFDRPAGAELLFLTTGENPFTTPPAYFEAREQGARWIIGPLQPESIEALLNLAGLVTPVLALNSLPSGYLVPPGMQGQIFGLSLSQEEEVRAIARQAISGDLRRALILTPESPWGERMAAIFRDEFLRDDTEILASSRFLESENDHSAVLERWLKIDESKARKQRLENTLQMPLEFEPVRRDDVDVIFLAAGAVQGRLLRPQLRFHSAGDIPVYATSRIYTGMPDPVRDQDLDGVRFPITPFQLRARGAAQEHGMASLRAGTFASLFALGKDAWEILPWLELLRRDPDFRYFGESGTYRAGPDGNLAREPAFAEFRSGRPAPARLTGTAVAPR